MLDYRYARIHTLQENINQLLVHVFSDYQHHVKGKAQECCNHSPCKNVACSSTLRTKLSYSMTNLAICMEIRFGGLMYCCSVNE